MINDIIKWIRAVLETDVGIVIVFCLTIADITRRIRYAFLGIKKKPAIPLLSAIGLLGIGLPVLVLISCPWNNTLHIILNSVAVFALLNFFGLLYIIRVMHPFLKLRNKIAKI